MQFTLSTAVIALAILVGTVIGETHTVRLINNCLRGTPTLIVGNPSEGPSAYANTDFVFNGPLTNAVGFLQTGSCGPAGENCTAIQFSLVNGDEESAAQSFGSVRARSPYAFSVPAGFSFSNGCDGIGAYCAEEECPERNVTVTCIVDDVDLTATFCDEEAA